MKRTGPDPLTKAIIHLLCYGLALTMLVPFLWMLSASLKTNQEVFLWPPTLIPRSWEFKNYALAWEVAHIGRYFMNSLIVTAVVTTFSLFFNTLAGYCFAKLRFPGKNRVFLGVIATMMLPQQVAIIFAYLFIVRLGYAGTYQCLILPGLAGAFGIFYMRQSIQAVPDDLIDAARVDGLTPFEIFLWVVLPLIRPALSALGILTFLGSWNSFFWPLIVVDSAELKTLPLAVADLSAAQVVQSWPILMAAATLIITPSLLVFLIFQRQFIRGIAMTGLKG
ncbi:MAG: carbohydrate ABC transporter permease [Candidatus Omnitrophica bacterium]|nr:L-arabinose transport system permease protein AraQ [bacterium]NUN98119.1 carbohydrate ABC transporter permease [Candidatus Omnitrophota bacterium]